MMTKDRKNIREPVLPPELAGLDAELSSLRYEERPSFGPELEAELAREWMSLRGRRPCTPSVCSSSCTEFRQWPPWYRLRAEIQDRATGDIRDLPIQPSGETGFRASWDRRPAPEGVTSEFVSVWLGDVPSGRYILRLVADVPDAGTPLMAEQELDRR